LIENFEYNRKRGLFNKFLYWIRKNNFLGLCFLIPSLLFLVLLIIYPIISNVWDSFFKINYFEETRTFIGFGNYLKVLKDSVFWKAFTVNVIWTVFSLIGQLGLGLFAAILVNRETKGMVVVRSILLIPYIIPVISLALISRWMLNDQYGIITNLLILLGLQSPDTSVLADVNLALPAVIAVNIYHGFPFAMIVYWAALQSIPQELYEASSIDGANGWKQFIHITLPQLKTITFTLLVLRTIWTFNYFDIPYLMTQGGPAQSTQHLPILIYTESIGLFNFGTASSIAMLMALVLTVLVFIYIRLFGKQEFE